MQQRGQKTTFQIRLQISERAASGLNDSQIASALDCSVWTVRKWRRRSHKQGRSSFTSRMGRPATGPVSTFPHELQEALLQLRKLHPGWGPITLLAELKRDDCWQDQPRPRRARIATLLKQAGLTRRYLPHNDLLQPPRVSLSTPHQEWQMDAEANHASRRGGQGESHHDCRWSEPTEGRKVSQPRARPIRLCPTTNCRYAERF
jgi:transposase